MVSLLCFDKAKEADRTMRPAQRLPREWFDVQMPFVHYKVTGFDPSFYIYEIVSKGNKKNIHLKDPRTMLDTSPDSLSLSPPYIYEPPVPPLCP